MGKAREAPFATAAAVGGAVAVGVFLWSRRNQISDQIGNLADQIGEWRDNLGSDSDFGSQGGSSGGSFMASSGSSGRGAGRSQSEIAEEALTLSETGRSA